MNNDSTIHVGLDVHKESIMAAYSISLCIRSAMQVLATITIDQGLGYRSSGVRPVCLAMRASMRGPISSPSWNAKTKSGDPGFCRVLCEPV